MQQRVNAILLAACLAVACSQSSGVSAAGDPPTQDETAATEPSAPAACIAHEAPAASTLAAPVADFANDVAPILVKSCAFAACHASKGAANHGLFLNATADDVDAVKASLLAKAKTAPSMAYVAPGDPDGSFVMHKLDGDQCTLAAKCAGGDCGKSMPSGNDLLPEESRDAIRRWIAQGAK